MTKLTIQERLQALAKGDDKRTKAGRFRDVYPDVEAAISSGVSHEVIVEVLKEGGLDMSIATFRSTLQRIRAKQPKNSLKTESVRPSNFAPGELTTAKPDKHVETPDAEPVASHDPKEIDKIIGSQPDLDGLAKLGRRNKT